MSEPAPSQPEPTPFEKMQALATRVLSVPKAEVDRREEQWREERKATAQRKREAQQ